jgi:signal transduction histidine kinase
VGLKDLSDPRLARIDELIDGFGAELGGDPIDRLLAGIEAITARLAMLERDCQAHSRILARLSHEVRTPLSGVIGMVDVLQETPPLTDEQRDYIEAIRRGTRALMEVIDRFQRRRNELGKAP